MKKILIVTYYYKHKNAMASIRPIKLAKYFSAMGNDVYVLTSKQKDTWTAHYNEVVNDSKIKEMYADEDAKWKIVRKYLDHRGKVGNRKILLSEEKKDNKSVDSVASGHRFRTALKSKLSWLFYFALGRIEDVCMFHGMRRRIKSENIRGFDFVIATYPNYGAFLTGIWLKKKGYCKKFIADFRDPLYNPGFKQERIERRYDLKCLRKTMKYSDKVVCVSNGIADSIKQVMKPIEPDISVITNGYDTDDVYNNNVSVSFDDEKINFVYTGVLYHGKRCVDTLAKVLKRLIEEKKIDRDSFTFEYAGNDYYELLSQLKKYGSEFSANDHGFISRDMAIAMQKAADILLLLTWNEKEYQGVIPGKLFEYMAIGTVPIVALISGNVKNSEVSQIIKDTNVGIAVEEADGKNGEDALYRYLVDVFSKRVSTKNRNAEKYNYYNISKEYMKLLED